MSKRELEDHLKTIYTENQRHEQRDIPPDMPPIPQPEHQCNNSPPKCSEVEKAVQKWKKEIFMLHSSTWPMLLDLTFTLAMELIIKGSKWVVGGERLQSGL